MARSSDWFSIGSPGIYLPTDLLYLTHTKYPLDDRTHRPFSPTKFTGAALPLTPPGPHTASPRSKGSKTVIGGVLTEIRSTLGWLRLGAFDAVSTGTEVGHRFISAWRKKFIHGIDGPANLGHGPVVE